MDLSQLRSGKVARAIAASIVAEVETGRRYAFMEFCGGHTHAIFRHDIDALLPAEVRMIHGPGCPVCVLPRQRLDMALALVEQPGVILCTFGDMARVPASHGKSLLSARAAGHRVEIVYSATDALAVARNNPESKIVFLAVGFETTSPGTAATLVTAEREGLDNFFVLCNHVLTPPAIRHMLEAPEMRELGNVTIDGFVGPAHVSTVIGTRPYHYFAEEFSKPVVIAGFEPSDILHAILLLLRQVNSGRAVVENQYTRLVTEEGNPAAQAMVADCFELRPRFEWRGLGVIPYSAFGLRERFRAFDAEAAFDIVTDTEPDNPACLCGAVLRGAKQPDDCKLFATVCTPDNPIGSCMVSHEGTCAAYFAYRRSASAV